MSVASIETEPLRSQRVGDRILQVVVALAFFVAGGAKVAGAPFMVQLIAQIGVGQWFRIVTGTVEIIGASALMQPRLTALDGLWLGATMFLAVLTHLFVAQTNPAGAIMLGPFSALIVYLRRDDLASLLRTIATRA
jgi:putative oxidoreductase